MAHDDDIREIFYHQDIENNRAIAGFSYLLFFLPLMIRPHSAFCRFHANQALVLLILFSANIALRMFLIFFPTFGKVLFYLIGSVLAYLLVAGMFAAFRGRAKKLPVIGHIRLLS